MGDIPLLCRLDLVQQVLGGRCVGSAASKHIDDLFKTVDMLRALIDIPLSDLQMSKKHRAVHRQHHSPTIGRWLLIQLTLGETCVKAHTPWEKASPNQSEPADFQPVAPVALAAIRTMLMDAIRTPIIDMIEMSRCLLARLMLPGILAQETNGLPRNA